MKKVKKLFGIETGENHYADMESLDDMSETFERGRERFIHLMMVKFAELWAHYTKMGIAATELSGKLKEIHDKPGGHELFTSLPKDFKDVIIDLTDGWLRPMLTREKGLRDGVDEWAKIVEFAVSWSQYEMVRFDKAKTMPIDEDEKELLLKSVDHKENELAGEMLTNKILSLGTRDPDGARRNISDIVNEILDCDKDNPKEMVEKISKLVESAARAGLSDHQPLKIEARDGTQLGVIMAGKEVRELWEKKKEGILDLLEEVKGDGSWDRKGVSEKIGKVLKKELMKDLSPDYMMDTEVLSAGDYVDKIKGIIEKIAARQGGVQSEEVPTKSDDETIH